jgi:hypothetical protein
MSTPVDDTPVRLQNTYTDATSPVPGTVISPVDPYAQWNLVRWAKSRPGTLLADRYGPVWVQGGATALMSISPDVAQVQPMEAWGLEEVLQQDRVALRAVSAQQTVTGVPATPTVIGTFLGFIVQRGMGTIVPYPITAPSLQRKTTYMEVPDVANVAVPVAAMIAGAGWNGLIDLRRRPGQILYVDKNVTYLTTPQYSADIDNGWSIARDYRIWLYAPVGAVFEVCTAVTYMLPYEDAIDEKHGDVPFGNNIQNPQDYTLQKSLAHYINSALSTNLSEEAGVEAFNGLDVAQTQAIADHAQNTQKQTLYLRAAYKSLVNAIHDICPAYLIPQGQARQYKVDVRFPQVWARLVAPQPQFAVTGGISKTK